MRRRIAKTVLMACALSACAVGARTPVVSTSNGGAIVGWISFRGEFLIYPRQEDIGRTLDQSCTSGTFARMKDFRTAARRFDGKRVRVVGRLLPANSYFSDSGLGQRIENYCGSSQVLIASRIDDEPLRR